MRRVLVDVNVVVDVLLNRAPHAEASARVWAMVESRTAEGLLAAHALTTIHYLVRKEEGSTKAVKIVTALLRLFRVAAVDQSVIERALRLPAPDFEDAVTAAAAEAAGCVLIVTRDPKGFRVSPVQAVTPEAAAHILSEA